MSAITDTVSTVCSRDLKKACIARPDDARADFVQSSTVFEFASFLREIIFHSVYLRTNSTRDE